MTNTTIGTKIDLEAVVELEYFLGEFFEELIELECNMTLCEFLDMFWNADEKEFTI